MPKTKPSKSKKTMSSLTGKLNRLIAQDHKNGGFTGPSANSASNESRMKMSVRQVSTQHKVLTVTDCPINVFVHTGYSTSGNAIQFLSTSTSAISTNSWYSVPLMLGSSTIWPERVVNETASYTKSSFRRVRIRRQPTVGTAQIVSASNTLLNPGRSAVALTASLDLPLTTSAVSSISGWSYDSVASYPVSVDGPPGLPAVSPWYVKPPEDKSVFPLAGFASTYYGIAGQIDSSSINSGTQLTLTAFADSTGSTAPPLSAPIITGQVYVDFEADLFYPRGMTWSTVDVGSAYCCQFGRASGPCLHCGRSVRYFANRDDMLAASVRQSLTESKALATDAKSSGLPSAAPSQQSAVKSMSASLINLDVPKGYVVVRQEDGTAQPSTAKR